MLLKCIRMDQKATDLRQIIDLRTCILQVCFFYSLCVVSPNIKSMKGRYCLKLCVYISVSAKDCNYSLFDTRVQCETERPPPSGYGWIQLHLQCNRTLNLASRQSHGEQYWYNSVYMALPLMTSNTLRCQLSRRVTALIIGFYPDPGEGNTMETNPVVEKGMCEVFIQFRKPMFNTNTKREEGQRKVKGSHLFYEACIR